ncbi:MAG: hypothetical protein NT154_13730 [Verrucomicrobia bacterium]|nr:hypothetical protein [Verrucomicrobiota bacterium]
MKGRFVESIFLAGVRRERFHAQSFTSSGTGLCLLGSGRARALRAAERESMFSGNETDGGGFVSGTPEKLISTPEAGCRGKNLGRGLSALIGKAGADPSPAPKPDHDSNIVLTPEASCPGEKHALGRGLSALLGKAEADAGPTAKLGNDSNRFSKKLKDPKRGEPGLAAYKRVQGILESDPSLKEKLGPLTMIKRHGNTARFPKAVLELTDNIHAQGSDIEKQSKTTILWYANEILVLGQALRLTGESEVVDLDAQHTVAQEPAALVGQSEPPVAPPPTDRRHDNRVLADPKDQAASAEQVESSAFDKHNPAHWIRIINSQLAEAFDLYGKTAEKLFAVGLTYLRAKTELGYRLFGKLFGPGGSRIGQDTAEKLIKIVKNPVLKNSANCRNLPPALNTLYRLSKIEPAALQKAIDAQRVSPMMSMREASALATELDGKTQVETEKNLDYFRKSIGGHLHRKISAIADQELRQDVIAELIKLLQGMAETGSAA